MQVETLQYIHFGVNFVLAPLPVISGSKLREFQSRLAEEGIEFTQTGLQGQDMRLGVNQPPLNVRVTQSGPQVGQLLVIAGNPNRPLKLFEEETGIVCAAFSDVWPGKFQIISRDCTIRSLYVANAEHAFKYLWEERLQQSPDQLSYLRRTVLGGGLRFVMPPVEDAEDSATVELKIESFLRDSTRLFVDVSFTWQQPMAPGTHLSPEAMLEEVNDFATGAAVDFILGGAK